MNKPYVLVKCAMSLDGYIDDSSSQRLILSDETDFNRVYEERAKCDAILLGANTVRNDNPRAINKEHLREKRIAEGKPGDLIKITITSSGNLSKDSKFFNFGDNKKLVYCNKKHSDKLSKDLEDLADVDVISVNDNPIDPEFILEDLHYRGIKKLMIEGGSNILTTFLSTGLVDELQLSIAPFFVGENDAIPFVKASKFINNKNNRMTIKNVEMLGDCALLTYLLK